MLKPIRAARRELCSSRSGRCTRHESKARVARTPRDDRGLPRGLAHVALGPLQRGHNNDACTRRVPQRMNINVNMTRYERTRRRAKAGLRPCQPRSGQMPANPVPTWQVPTVQHTFGTATGPYPGGERAATHYSPSPGAALCKQRRAAIQISVPLSAGGRAGLAGCIGQGQRTPSSLINMARAKVNY